MAYDEHLRERIRRVVQDQPEWVEKKMFGGVGFMVGGNMACGVLDDLLIVRVGLENYQTALGYPHTRLFDTRGRAMRGWVMVEPAGCEQDNDLEMWVKQGVEFALTLPPK